MRALLSSALTCFLLAQDQIAMVAHQQSQAANEQAQRDVHVQISIKDGKNSFHSGEPIRLVMSFTADQPGYSVVGEFEPPDMPGITITPDTGVARWLEAVNHLEDTVFSDASYSRPLSAHPLEVVVALNWSVRFDGAGDYTVRKTAGIRGPNNASVGVASNSVSFHIDQMSDEAETAEIRRLKALMDVPDKPGSFVASEACEDLLFLPGEAAAREKAHLLLNPVQRLQSCSANAKWGLYLSRNPQQVASLLEQVLAEKTASIESWNIDQVSTFRVWSEMPSLIAQAQGDDSTLRRLQQERAGALRREHVIDIASRLADLPLDARRRVALELTKGPGPMPPAARDVLVDQFEALSPAEQLTLAITRWRELDAPATVLPVLRQALTVPAQTDSADRELALRALLELSPAEGQSRLITEVLERTSSIEPQALPLPKTCLMVELDRPLVALLTELAPSHDDEAWRVRETKAMWLARCGTAAVQKDVRRLYDDERLGKGARAYLLSYLAKWNEQDASPLITRAAAAEDAPVELYWRVTRFTYPHVVDGLLRLDLESTDVTRAAPAAYLLAEHGLPETRSLLEARLARWMKEWGNRRAAVEADEIAPKNAAPQSDLQTALIRSIIYAQSWKVTDAEARALRETCVTSSCRRRVEFR